MEKKELLYEGKAKKVFSTEDPDLCIVSYKDDATAFNGEKKGTIVGKGVVNNRMSNFMFKLLEKHGIATDFVEELNDRDTVLKKVEIVPLEVILRNKAAGSLSKRLGLPEGTPMKTPVLEFCYKNDELGDPMVNEYHILAAGFATKEEIDTITEMAFKINEIMIEFFKQRLELCIGGVRNYSDLNLYRASKGLEKFSVFVGWRVRICSNQVLTGAC